MIWVLQVIASTVYVTCCGVFATYYFLGIASPAGKVRVPVDDPTAKSADRALSTSFGSICLGSLLIPIILPIAVPTNSTNNNSGGPCCLFCICCAECCVAIFGSSLQYLSRVMIVDSVCVCASCSL